MKNIFFFLFLFCFSCAVAQEKAPCDGMNNDYNIRKTYLRDIAPRLDRVDLITFHFTDENSKVRKMYAWAKSEGYFAKLDSVKEKSKGDTITIEVIKKLNKPSLEYFTSEYKKILRKKEEFGIQDCGGFSMTNNIPSQKEPCYGMYSDSVFKTYYDRSLKNNISIADTIKFRFMIEASGAQKIKDWADANGFKTYPFTKLYSGEPGDDFVFVVFTKQLKEPLYDFFAATIKQVGKMKDELGVGCGHYYVSY